MNTRKTVLTILGIIFAVVAIAAFVKWSEWHDQKIFDAAERYSKCVFDEYHTTPSAYYEEHGEYPECDLSKYVDETNDNTD